jgi:hypothetical protein
MPRKTHHVTPNKEKGGWDVKKGGGEKTIKHTITKKEAVDAVRSISQNQKTELVIQNKDGKISKSDSHGHDPNPPKDRDNKKGGALKPIKPTEIKGKSEKTTSTISSNQKKSIRIQKGKSRANKSGEYTISNQAKEKEVHTKPKDPKGGTSTRRKKDSLVE